MLASCGSNAVDLSPEIEEMVKKAEKGFLGNAGGEMIRYWGERSVYRDKLRTMEHLAEKPAEYDKLFDAYTNSESH
jgi:hypothetical protein